MFFFRQTFPGRNRTGLYYKIRAPAICTDNHTVCSHFHANRFLLKFSSIQKWLMFLRLSIRVTFHRVLLSPTFVSSFRCLPPLVSRMVSYFPVPPCSPLLDCCHRQNAIPYRKLTPPPVHLCCSFLYTKSPPGSSPPSHFNGVIAVYCRGTWQCSAKTRSESSLIFPPRRVCDK